MQTIIDTMGIMLPTDEGIQETTTIKHVGYDSNTKQAKVKVTLHGQYGEGSLNELDKHLEITNLEIEKAGFDGGKLIMDRIDIAIDTNEYTFENDFKMLLLIYELLTVRNVKNGARWFNTNVDTLSPNCIEYMDRTNRSFNLAIYDKKYECMSHPYATRIEFRHKRLGLGVEASEKWLRDAIERLSGMETKLEQVELYMVERLVRKYKEEVEKGLIKSFSEFVRKHNDYFYTLNILKGVYDRTGLKGNYKTWLKDFRKSNELKFITKGEIKTFAKMAIKSVKAYIN